MSRERPKVEIKLGGYDLYLFYSFTVAAEYQRQHGEGLGRLFTDDEGEFCMPAEGPLLYAVYFGLQKCFQEMGGRARRRGAGIQLTMANVGRWLDDLWGDTDAMADLWSAVFKAWAYYQGAKVDKVDRMADATGIPLDPWMVPASAQVREELDLNRFAAAVNTPGVRD